MRFTALILGTLAGLTCFTGCATYQFDLVRPPELARHIGEDREEVFKLDPLEYRMQSYEGRLVIRIFNPTGDVISLDGARSSAVDPDGESHPLPDRTIAPASWIKLILPPLRPQIEGSGPNIGIGFGIIGDRNSAFYPAYGGDPSFYDVPRYYDVVVPADSHYWEWEGQSDVRLFLFYQRKSGDFHHEFLFHRQRM